MDAQLFHKYSPHCPCCGSLLPQSCLKIGLPFKCPSCDEELRTHPLYTWVVCLFALLLSGWVSLVVGLRGLALVVAILVLSWPSLIAGMVFVWVVLRPKAHRHILKGLTLYSEQPCGYCSRITKHKVTVERGGAEVITRCTTCGRQPNEQFPVSAPQ